MRNNINLQDAFINKVRKENISITIYLINGYKFKGIVKGFDNYTIVLENEGKQHLIYKHAISTISPNSTMNFLTKNTPQNNQNILTNDENIVE
ncbi:RNA chaperone Hfq [Caloranaerobacter sp. TR13]|uniref:RNA chaperone Hfq n=1 Tax=Caloranaerobacter sp. TR13 TaxID=1302151 RepID=UPI0006D431BB|nr:RNA chaperone Hfq [Caloranaerobacter sp. TR13]